jgi:riboflavin synthase
MFTGIIRQTGKVVSVKSASQGKRLTIECAPEFVSKLEAGITSVAIDGACHTVETMEDDRFTVFSSFETLKKTTIGSLSSGSPVNLELPLTPQTLLDGHLVQGHVDETGVISSIRKQGEAFLYRFSADNAVLKFLVEKDSIAVDGISLTLFHVDDSSFQVAVIPETIKNTSLSRKKEGGKVNLEVNIFAKYSMKFSKERAEKFASLAPETRYK